MMYAYIMFYMLCIYIYILYNVLQRSTFTLTLTLTLTLDITLTLTLKSPQYFAGGLVKGGLAL